MADSLLAGRRVAVLGAARSGIAAANLLADRGARVLLSDTGSEEALAAHLERLSPGIEVITGRNELGDADLVVTSPGLPTKAAPLVEAEARGIPVWAEPELAFACIDGEAEVLAITGTDGKSTVTLMLAHVLRESGRPAWAGGNLGNPFCEGVLAGEVTGTGRAVLEISCFQLRHVLRLRPRVAALLNVAEDHLDVHGTLADYAAAKARVFERQGPGDTAVHAADQALCAGPAQAAGARGARAVAFRSGPPPAGGWGLVGGSLAHDVDGRSETLIALSELPLPGDHNVANALAVAAMATAHGVDAASIAAALRTFVGLPHRIELVAEAQGVRWINDSKATNPHAAAAGLRSMGAAPVLLLCGGVDKGLSLAPLIEAAEGRVRLALVFGQISDRMASALAPAAERVEQVPDLAAAVTRARTEARPGDAVLLGPACSSFDQFTSYGARGEAFRELVRSS